MRARGHPVSFSRFVFFRTFTLLKCLRGNHSNSDVVTSTVKIKVKCEDRENKHGTQLGLKHLLILFIQNLILFSLIL